MATMATVLSCAGKKEEPRSHAGLSSNQRTQTTEQPTLALRERRAWRKPRIVPCLSIG